MSDDLYTDSFLKFYDVYPRKVGKRPAAKAWTKLSDDEKRAATADVDKRNRAHWWSSDPKKIAHPATYLNAARWEDEWQGDLLARKEAQTTSGRDPANYRPVPDEKNHEPMKAWAQRRAFAWLYHVGGVGPLTDEYPTGPLDAFVRRIARQNDDSKRIAAVVNRVVRQAEPLREEKDKREATRIFADMLFRALDDEFGTHAREHMMLGLQHA